MKQLLSILLLSICLYAEATFDQVQSMIDKQQYKQAVLALSVIADNHPNSSKVQFTLAQAQAGLGNLPAAKEALDRAIALNPKLDFVPASQVEELSKTINAVRVIKRVEESTNWTLWILLMVGTSFVVAFFLRSKPKPEAPKPDSKYEPTPAPKPYSPNSGTAKADPVISESYTAPTPGFARQYESRYNHRDSTTPIPSRPTEVHHHHTTNNNGSDVLTTMAVAGVTAAAVSMAMDHNDRPTHSYQPEPISSSWNDDSSTSSTWDSPSESTSSSWKDDSSSSSASWSDSSSSSSWND